MATVFKIIPTVQQYDWGKIGKTSKVAQFATSSKLPGFEIDAEAPYAELWMGTHPKSPSFLRSSNQMLSDYLADHPELIGGAVAKKFDTTNGNLPFLFKVLSIQKALSIQSHPDKPTAEKLHAEHPDIYKDPNHKPEMALAITTFKALCGFRPLPDIAAVLESTPELRALIPASAVEQFLSAAKSSTPQGAQEKGALKQLFSALMNADISDVKQQLDTIIRRYRAGETHEGEDGDLVKLVMKLNDQFPGDIGIFCAFVLNYITLHPGEAIFLGAGEPHAYISGECIECMANSDNVIRAGLTPKLRDISALVSGLTYIAGPPSKHVVNTRIFNPSSKAFSAVSPKLYDPPIPEFSVIQTKVPPRQNEFHRAIRGPSVAIVTTGNGKVTWIQDTMEVMELELGDVFFVGANTDIKLDNTGDTELMVYRAFVEAN